MNKYQANQIKKNIHTCTYVHLYIELIKKLKNHQILLKKMRFKIV